MITQERTQILKRIKTALQDSRWEISPRKVNHETLTLLGLNKKGVHHIIMDLIESDYSSGPEDDQNKPGSGEIWVFGAEIVKTTVLHKIQGI